MANIESKDLLVAVKSFARANPLPLDKDEIWDSEEAARAYMQSPTAYPGQSIKVLMENGKYKLFTVQKDAEDNLIFEEPEISVEATLQWGEF